MSRIYEAAAYSAASCDGCYWTETAPLPRYPALRGQRRVETAIIGGGFTGLNAALTLSAAGRDVLLCDAQQPGWGASGRNGGFCCLGGSVLDDRLLRRRHGAAAAEEWADAEREAVAHVANLIDTYGMEVDRHSDGETQIAHSPRAFEKLRRQTGALDRAQMRAAGFGVTGYGARTEPTGFGLNPRKYLAGLLHLLEETTVEICGDTTVAAIRGNGPFDLVTPQGNIRADKVLIATNGYSSDDVPPWLAARYLPVQSAIAVTRPLTQEERAAQGWVNDQMCYDTRKLLHYFRMLPEGRMLFGMRGGIRADGRAWQRRQTALRRDFDVMFPAWRDVPFTHIWGGLACLSRSGAPYVGPVGAGGLYASFAYHGNGVAMGSWCGHLAGRLMMGDDLRPEVLRHVPRRFPFGRFRRGLLYPLYAGLTVRDWLSWP